MFLLLLSPGKPLIKKLRDDRNPFSSASPKIKKPSSDYDESFVIPPNFIHTSPHGPLRVLTYSVRCNGRLPETLLSGYAASKSNLPAWRAVFFRICLLRNALPPFYPRPFPPSGLSVAYSNRLLFSFIAINFNLLYRSRTESGYLYLCPLPLFPVGRYYNSFIIVCQ